MSASHQSSEFMLINNFVKEVHEELHKLLFLGVDFNVARLAATEGISKKYLCQEYKQNKNTILKE